MSHKLALAPLAGLAITVVVAFALPGHAYRKGHGHSGGGHGAHHSAHHAGSSGSWRQSSGSASRDAGNTPAGRPSGVGQLGRPTSPVPTTVYQVPQVREAISQSRPTGQELPRWQRSAAEIRPAARPAVLDPLRAPG